jgi:hypothetical protein
MDSFPWPDTVDEIIGGDQVVMLASVTPARGVVLAPLTNFAVRDRDAGTFTLNSSIGGWKKLERLRRDPRVAIAFHTRRHARTGRPEYVLLQGDATLSPPIADYPEKFGPEWERFDGPQAKGPVWDRWLRVYYMRVLIEVKVKRLVVWPDLACQGTPEVYGVPLPQDEPASQRPPGKGTAPRLDQAKAARQTANLPETLLGWSADDGYPMVVPARVEGHDRHGLLLDAPFLPEGGRRAGLTSHRFERQAGGQVQRVFTGWLETSPKVRYSPHTEFVLRMPSSKTVYRIGMGVAMRVAMHRARRAGFTFA